ncbi:N-acetylglucosamine-binding protein GbpA [Vibrio sp. S9_S30]|uniref:N-acetylglucosamine-binding protein GbpA n=1 Tax=Vibrio sp. S9_S30 TaxID=2720226 RepID=UPI001681C10F|nr:N-acetylglucosamine-binding protein GbpA [Vibrio sp. S9_S30]MBD1558168.1 N-acetylglucosamine-binding protein GbpA [Vibrio sp. S9_S30]
MNKYSKYSLLTIALLGVSGACYSHGYISTHEKGVVEGRVTLCKYAAKGTGERNHGCGAIRYEPQSVEGPDGFPNYGPADGRIASAQTGLAAALDEQTADRWVKRPIKAGSQYFEWTFTASHVTKDWKYYITKTDWNPNQPLARSSFDLTPFCVINGRMSAPPRHVNHLCDVPEREGYHVILSVWDVGDTGASFYNVIDVKFEGDGSSQPAPVKEWEQTGQISPSMDLNVGDSVFTRVFDESGEAASYSTELVIENEAQKSAKNWSHALASKINQEQTQIRAGQSQSNGEFTPNYGVNPIFIKAGSGLKNIEIGYKINTPVQNYDLDITGLKSEYLIGEQPTVLDFALNATGSVSAEFTVYNHHKEALATHAMQLADGQNSSASLTLSKSEPGHHMLVAVIKDQQGSVINQQTFDFLLKAENGEITQASYDFVFPEGLEGYTSGTRVLSQNGRVYQCKGFPQAGYCKQWGPRRTNFEPGVGLHWYLAWDEVL